MKVILLQDVARTGRKFEVVTVPDGYAQNNLIPKGMAKLATQENIKNLKNRKRVIAISEDDMEKHFSEALEYFKGKTIDIKVKANDQGGLFEGVDARDIKDTLVCEHTGINEDHISLDHPIKHTGTYDIIVESKKQKGIIHIQVLAK